MLLIDDADRLEPVDDTAANLCTLARHLQVPVVATVESESALRADAEHWIPLGPPKQEGGRPPTFSDHPSG
jgi:hypothetical protein